jgi:hypothetical protein
MSEVSSHSRGAAWRAADGAWRTSWHQRRLCQRTTCCSLLRARGSGACLDWGTCGQGLYSLVINTLCHFTILDVCRATCFRWESICGLDSDCGSHLLALNPAKSCLPFGVKFPAYNDCYCSTDTCMSSWWCPWAFAFGLAALLQDTPIWCLHLLKWNTILYPLSLCISYM